MKIIEKIKRRIGLIYENHVDLKHLLYNQKRVLLEQNLLHDTISGISSTKYCEHEFIVSLTTYGDRINDVALTIESIMEQTMKANRIVLWLANEFKNKRLPNALSLLQVRGLEIRYCQDIRSYKKLIPSLRIFPDDAIITIDDDVLYEPDLLDKLISAYLENPQYIYCTQYHRMDFNVDGSLKPYTSWVCRHSDRTPSQLNCFLGTAGVLYPPHSLDEEVLNEEVFMDICKYADDIWFHAMALKKGTLVQKVFTHDCYGIEYLENPNFQQGLCVINEWQGMNDVQLKSVFDKYDLYKCLKSNSLEE